MSTIDPQTGESIDEITLGFVDGLHVERIVVRHDEVVLIDADARESVLVQRGSYPGAGLSVDIADHVKHARAGSIQEEDPMAGPQERKLRNRLRFKLTGRWPASVVRERLMAMDYKPVRQGLEDPAHANATKSVYTLDEAQRELARRECRLRGHDWDIIETMGHGPTALVCSRCGENRMVEPKA